VCRALAALDDERAVNRLRSLLHDKEASVRDAAYTALLKIFDKDPLAVAEAGLTAADEDVRRRGLETLIATIRKKAPKGPGDPGLRAEAFNFATKKNKEIAVLETALASRHPDARKLAVEGLIKKHSKAAQQVLLRAIADPDRDVRLLAVNALVDDDAKGPLKEAMASPLPDIRVRAAAALAKHGDAATLPVLRELATAPEPLQQERVSDWLEAAELALYGLAELGEPAALPDVVPLLDSKHAALRKAAAVAL